MVIYTILACYRLEAGRVSLTQKLSSELSVLLTFPLGEYPHEVLVKYKPKYRAIVLLYRPS